MNRQYKSMQSELLKEIEVLKATVESQEKNISEEISVLEIL